MTARPHTRVLVKLSGEALMGSAAFGIDSGTLLGLAQQIKAVRAASVEVGIVVGGGNYWRGTTVAEALGMEEATAHYAGMLATIMNALALQDTLEANGVTVRTQTAIAVQAVAE